MNRQELIDAVAARTGESKASTGEGLKAFIQHDARCKLVHSAYNRQTGSRR